MKVSIILPSYNHEKFLNQRLETIASQSFTDFELIIIDDKSNDQSVQIISSFLNKYPKINCSHFIINENNSGSGYNSWQKGINLAQGEFIWIAETDDYSDIDFLKKTTELLTENPEASLVFTSSIYVNEESLFLYNSTHRTKELNVEDQNYDVFESDVLLKKLPLDPFITNGSSVLFRKPEKKIPKIIFENKQMSDLFLWTYLLKSKKFIFLNKKLNYFRRHDSSTTSLNTSVNQEKIFNEYVNYINFFSSECQTIKKVIYSYIKTFIFSKQNSNGFFYFKPIFKIKKINTLKLYYYIFKIYLVVLFSKIKKRIYA